ncbi:hypothetical protein C8J55DRAFT_440835 [Lentinula edodes]|uniref:DNase I-like protein n=1 Tax=Lentinula lateritia TaxID=40482 RepID=A0A9W9DE20_9AGAR|nr:hypothetical protein C8J55DRAFT_440835 [Lentinula edodes]
MVLPSGLPTLRSFSTGNYTRVDNVFCSEELTDHVIICRTTPERQPIKTDHFPIVTVLDLQNTVVEKRERWNWAQVDWEDFRENMSEEIQILGNPRELETEAQFWAALTAFDQVVEKVVKEKVPRAWPSPHQRRWWNSQLDTL